MSMGMSPPVLVDELLAYLFDGQWPVLAQPMRTWLTASRRFTAFVDSFRTKIRKKIRVMQKRESSLDLRLELETAYLLLQERSLSVIYEPLLSEKSRGPDFAVSFTTSTDFMVEVTRLRVIQVREQDLENQLHEAVCSKLGQMVAGQANILLVGVERAPLPSDVLHAAMLHLQQRAERNDPTIL